MERVTGSFRDPDGYVFLHAGRVFRALSAGAEARIQALEAQGCLSRWASEGLVVGTRFVREPELKTELIRQHPGFPAFLEHDRIEPITYPYEWSTGMLVDAGLLTLRLQNDLLSMGLSLKDATAYNIQFVRGKPVFIDLTSIEKPARLDLWYALGQFNRMFLFPLLLVKHAGWDLRSYFLARLDGRTTLEVGQAFSWAQRWSPSRVMDLGLPYALERRAQGRSGGAARTTTHAPEAAAGNPAIHRMTLGRLKRKIEALARAIQPRTVWADYVQTCSYDDTAEESKKEHVRDFLQQVKPANVLDIGCNTGDYARIAAAGGAAVMATDFDVGAVEQMYQRLKTEPACITPMVVDLANPSPGLGFMNQERPSFLDRAAPDCVLALAVLHHLLVGANLPLESICDLLARLSRRHLVLEFVPTEDEMFRRLLEFRVNLFHEITLERCVKIFSDRFTLLRQAPIAHSPRTLLLFEKRT